MPMDSFNNKFFQDLGRSAGVVKIVQEAAETVAEVARYYAPVKTGAYRDGIKVTKKYQQRVVYLVTATAPHSLALEARTGHLARAVKQVGLSRRSAARG